MKREKLDLFQGTLDMLVMRTLSTGPLHGYAIGKRIREDTDELLRVEEGSLYPALHRMERRGWVDAEWERTETGRRAKFYRLTSKGRAELRDQARTWERFVRTIGSMMRVRPEEA